MLYNKEMKLDYDARGCRFESWWMNLTSFRSWYQQGKVRQPCTRGSSALDCEKTGATHAYVKKR